MQRCTPILVLTLLACDAGAGSPAADTQQDRAAELATAPPTSALTLAFAMPDAAAPREQKNVRPPAAEQKPVARTRDPALHGDSLAGESHEATSGPDVADPGIVRGLYVNRWAAQSPNRMRALIAMADSTEINALVLDLKDEFGLNYATNDSLLRRNAGTAGSIPRLRALIDTLRAHEILPIARLVVFKDSVAARVNPEHTIRTADGAPWRDREGLTWVNPYDREIWEYNIRVAEEVARLGFEEIQFDYIRFPEPYRSLPPQVFPGADGVSKPQALALFLREACPRIRTLGARCTADIFGLVTSVNGALEIGQKWEVLAPITDVLLPMVYPSHYPRGAFGIDRPNAEPHRVVHEAIARARVRNEKLGIDNPEHVRAWLQAFTLGEPAYGAEQVREQKQGVYDAGFDGWILWHPGSRYEPFLGGLERETVSRKQLSGIQADSSASPD